MFVLSRYKINVRTTDLVEDCGFRVLDRLVYRTQGLMYIVVLCYIATLFGTIKGTELTFNVVDYGAVGDGLTDDSLAFIQTWDEVCKAVGEEWDMPTLIVPENLTFLVGPVKFVGRCKSNVVYFQVLGNILAPGPHQTRWKISNSWLSFSFINGLIINGTGEINGEGSYWWSKKQRKDLSSEEFSKRPTAFHISHCNNSEISGLSFVNPPRNHISINGCESIKVSNINISAPSDSPNTDGIEISASKIIQIVNSTIQTGDDCIAINGRTSYINVTGVRCGPGHGISVGSLGSRAGDYETVEEVYVYNCTFNGTTNGARIKTWQGGSGYARNIKFENITLSDVHNPIIIDQYYCTRKECKNQTEAVEVSEITFKEVKGSSASEIAINLRCSQSKACKNLVMDNIQIYHSNPDINVTSYCYNATGVATASTRPLIPCLFVSKD